MISKEETYKRVQRFLIENNGAPNAWRPELVRQLTDELETEGCPRSAFWSWKMRHPALLRKSTRLYTIGDILGDFIMNIDAVAERKAEYPVLGPEKEYRELKTRRFMESALVTESTGEAPEPGTIHEESFVRGNPVEDALFGGTSTVTVDYLVAELSRIKRNPADFVRKYADGSAWNRENAEKRRTAENVREAIERIDLRRVRTCEVCGNAFYSHSAQPGRVKACDIMLHPKKRTKFYCQVERDRALAIIRKHRKKAAA